MQALVPARDLPGNAQQQSCTPGFVRQHTTAIMHTGKIRVSSSRVCLHRLCQRRETFVAESVVCEYC
eukprot:6209682-Pleurochrysis_carterae.AAC.1